MRIIQSMELTNLYKFVILAEENYASLIKKLANNQGSNFVS